MAEGDVSERLRELTAGLADLRKMLKLNTLLSMPPRGTKIEARVTTAAWDNFTLPQWTASWTLQNQSAGENVRYAYTRVEAGDTYWLIFPQGNISRASSPDQVFFRRDSAGATGPTVVMEALYWTEDQIETLIPKVRTVVGKAAERQGTQPQAR